MKIVHGKGLPGHVVYATREPALFTNVLTLPKSPFALASQVSLPLRISLSHKLHLLAFRER